MRSWLLVLTALLPFVHAGNRGRRSPRAVRPDLPSRTARSQSHSDPGDNTPKFNSSDKYYVANAYYTGWHAGDFPLTNVSWDKYTHLTYAFAETVPNINITLVDPDDVLLPQFVNASHFNNVSALLSIGGWTGSLYFSSAVATPGNRTAFVKTVAKLIKDYSLDGIDFDWEYPSSTGIGCNTNNVNDTQNFLTFLQQLRTEIPQNSTLSAAVSLNPFAGPDGSPSTNVTAFAQLLDWITVMDYDVYGPSWSSSVGPNAPLNDTCAPVEDQQGSAVSAVTSWSKAGFPLDQIVLGVASYGHSFSVPKQQALVPASTKSSTETIALYPPFNGSAVLVGDKWDDQAATDECGNDQPSGGLFDFWGLVEAGFLDDDGTASNSKDITYLFDDCSQTPYVYNSTSEIMVSYDDATSFTAKGAYIEQTGLRGFSMWEAGGDFDDILLDAIRDAVGFNDPDCVDWDEWEEDGGSP